MQQICICDTLMDREKERVPMKRHRRLAWASVSHLMIDFICAWMIINRIPGSEAWFIKNADL